MWVIQSPPNQLPQCEVEFYFCNNASYANGALGKELW